jgi:hypothetical protein
VTATEERDVPASSPLASLREQIAQARAKRVRDLDVPDLDGVVVRVRALSQQEMDEATKPTNTLVANANVLMAACVGIFRRDGDRLVDIRPDGGAYVDDDGKVVGEPLRFNYELVEMLGLDPQTAWWESVPSLFVTDGHLIAAGNAVVDLSGYGFDFAESVGKASGSTR